MFKQISFQSIRRCFCNLASLICPNSESPSVTSLGEETPDVQPLSIPHDSTVTDEASLWSYQARLHTSGRWESTDGVYDGDTFVLLVDLGLRIWSPLVVRLRGINTPEINRLATREDGIRARDAVREFLSGGISDWPLIINLQEGDETDSFGRYLATVRRREDGLDLTEHLVSLGVREVQVRDS